MRDEIDQQLQDDETLLLCAGLVGGALARDLPDLDEDQRRQALIRGVLLMLRAGVYAKDGRLYGPDNPPIQGPLAFPVGNA